LRLFTLACSVAGVLWHIPHKEWNRLQHALHGNGVDDQSQNQRSRVRKSRGPSISELVAERERLEAQIAVLLPLVKEKLALHGSASGYASHQDQGLVDVDPTEGKRRGAELMSMLIHEPENPMESMPEVWSDLEVAHWENLVDMPDGVGIGILLFPSEGMSASVHDFESMDDNVVNLFSDFEIELFDCDGLVDMPSGFGAVSASLASDGTYSFYGPGSGLSRGAVNFWIGDLDDCHGDDVDEVHDCDWAQLGDLVLQRKRLAKEKKCRAIARQASRVRDIVS